MYGHCIRLRRLKVERHAILPVPNLFIDPDGNFTENKQTIHNFHKVVAKERDHTLTYNRIYVVTKKSERNPQIHKGCRER